MACLVLSHQPVSHVSSPCQDAFIMEGNIYRGTGFLSPRMSEVASAPVTHALLSDISQSHIDNSFTAGPATRVPEKVVGEVSRCSLSCAASCCDSLVGRHLWHFFLSANPSAGRVREKFQVLKQRYSIYTAGRSF